MSEHKEIIAVTALKVGVPWNFFLEPLLQLKLGHTVLWQLYNDNQKHVPNFWIYDAFLLVKQISI